MNQLSCHIQPHMSFHFISLYNIRLLLPVYITLCIPQVFQTHYLLRTHLRSLPMFLILIQVPLPVNTSHVFFCLLFQVYFPTLCHQYLLFYQLILLLTYPVDHHLQAIHPQGCQHYHSQRIRLVKLALILRYPQVYFYLKLQLKLLRGL